MTFHLDLLPLKKKKYSALVFECIELLTTSTAEKGSETIGARDKPPKPNSSGQLSPELS